MARPRNGVGGFAQGGRIPSPSGREMGRTKFGLVCHRDVIGGGGKSRTERAVRVVHFFTTADFVGR